MRVEPVQHNPSIGGTPCTRKRSRMRPTRGFRLMRSPVELAAGFESPKHAQRRRHGRRERRQPAQRYWNPSRKMKRLA